MCPFLSDHPRPMFDSRDSQDEVQMKAMTAAPSYLEESDLPASLMRDATKKNGERQPPG